MRMAFVIILVAAIENANSSGGAVPVTNSREDQFQALTEKDKEILRKGFAPNATTKDRLQANSICKESCEQCFDGVTCNRDCVRKHCF